MNAADRRAGAEVEGELLEGAYVSTATDAIVHLDNAIK